MRHSDPGNRHRHARRQLLDAPRFEILPLAGVLDRTKELPPGATVTVTSSPRHGLEATVATAEALAARGFVTVPHLAARQFTDDARLSRVLGRLHAAGVRDLFVVGGDSPATSGAFPDGLALLKAIDASGYRFDQIGIPSYPEGHPLIDDDTLWTALAEKQHYATYTVTQMCFDAGTIGRFAVAARDRGITLPIVVGIPGPANVAKLLRVSLRIGVGDSVRFARGHRSVTRTLLRPRAYRPDALLRGLAAQMAEQAVEVSSLHIYTFNEIDSTMQWLVRTRAAADRSGLLSVTEGTTDDHAH